MIATARASTGPSSTFSPGAGLTESERHRVEDTRSRARKRQRQIYDEAASLGDLPYCKDIGRRRACGQSLLEFLIRYFPHSTGLSPLGEDQLACVARMQVAIEEEGWVTNVMPRGFIKSTMSENSLLWALLYGKRRYAMFFAGTAGLAEKGVASVLSELITNDLLLEDFPEACIPFRALEGKTIRANYQTYRGQATNLECKKDLLRFANIPGFEGAGAILEAYGVLAPPRGARYKNEKGENVRPDLAVIDDPSTDDSAKSDTQNASRLRYIKNSISMMGGHGSEMSLVINATIIAEGDLASRLTDPEESPEIQGVRVAMVKEMPDALESHWLKEYAEIRRNYDRDNPRGRVEAKERSTQFLKENYEVMHAGSKVAWENIGLERTEISALQHALNILIDKGPDTFWAECQNKPLRPQGIESLEITKDVETRYSGLSEKIVPNDTSFLVFGVDVHAELLYFTVTAVQHDFTGTVIDYGTFPEQPNDIFTLRSAKNTLTKHYSLEKQKLGNERAIEQGVEDLVHELLNSAYRTANGDLFPVTGGAVDIGYKQTECKNAIRRLLPASDKVILTRGIGIGAVKKPMREYDLSAKKVIRYGPSIEDPRWIVPSSGRDGELYEVQFDSNFWKAVVASRLTQSATKSRWDLYGSSNLRTNHIHFAKHLMAEQATQVSANGRVVDEFNVVGHQDNHWFDTTVQCAVTASLCGAVLPVAAVAPLRADPTPTPKMVSDLEMDLGDERPFLITAR